MEDKFDEVMVERFRRTFVAGAMGSFAGRHPSLAVDGALPMLQSELSGQAGIRAVLSSLSQDYAIVAKAEYEKLSAILDICSGKCPPAEPCSYYDHCSKCKYDYIASLAKEATSHA